MSRKNNLIHDCNEGLLDARDPTVYLPSDNQTKPSPLLRQNFTQSWQRWKAREAEERAVQEREIARMEQEQRRLFGGDVDDDVSFDLLCPAMLDVVFRLFGDIDYTDP
jgi:hypothetical protein